MPWKPRRCRERGSGDCSKDGHTPAMGRMIAPSGLLAKSSGAAHTRANEDSPGVRRERGRARPMIPASRAPPWSRSGALSKTASPKSRITVSWTTAVGESVWPARSRRIIRAATRRSSSYIREITSPRAP